jgi:hypothetical protein
MGPGLLYMHTFQGHGDPLKTSHLYIYINTAVPKDVYTVPEVAMLAISTLLHLFSAGLHANINITLDMNPIVPIGTTDPPRLQCLYQSTNLTSYYP